MNKIKIVDCTIRDGGHLNNWNFSAECVRDSYITACKSNIDFFEIGYRNCYHQDNGEFYTCSDEFLMEFIEKDKNCKIAVMSDMGKSDIDLFKPCDKTLTPLSAVFVATYLKDLKDALIFCEKLYDKGYLVVLNLMAIYQYSDYDFDILKSWRNKNILESVCFADSFGSFFPADIERIANKLKSSGFENISFHSHNNLQMAFANSLKAIDLGLYSVDASVYGMGRDAGNLPIELLVAYLGKSDNKYNPVDYLKLIEKYYLDLYNSIGWGYSTGSLISGLKNVHPKYIKELAKSDNIEGIYRASEIISRSGLTAYDKNKLDEILYANLNIDNN